MISKLPLTLPFAIAFPYLVSSIMIKANISSPTAIGIILEEI